MKHNIQLFSPNMLKTFEHCSKKFYFKYIKNISMPTNDEIFEFGKNIHALASYYLKKENIARMEKSLTPKEADVWEYLKQSKYFKYDVVNTEHSLAFKLGKHFLGGRLDALVKDKDKYYILDYKTGSAPKNAKYDFQTMIYILAVKNFYNTDKISFVYLDLKNRTEVVTDFSAELEIEYIKLLNSIINKIEASTTLKTKENCKCEFEKICY